MVADWDDSGQAGWLEQKSIELLRGSGSLAGPGRVEVDGDAYEAERVVIATGSDPAIPPIEGLRGLEGVWTNREATAVTELPERLLVLGGGPVGLELGQAFARMGASVAIVEAEPHPLPREAPAVGEALAEALRGEGIELRLGAPVTNRLPRSRGLPGGGDRLAGAQQGLGGDAGPVGALPGDQLALDYRHTQAAVGQLARADLAGRAGADHDRIEMPLLAHSHLSSILR